MTTQTTEPNYKELLLSLIASMTLADHMGDVCDDVQTVMDKMGIECSVDLSGEGDAQDFKRLLHNMGAKTVYGTEIWDADDEVEYLSEREDE